MLLLLCPTVAAKGNKYFNHLETEEASKEPAKILPIKSTIVAVHAK